MSSEDTAGTQPSRRGRVALGGVLVVLLLAIAAGAVWFFVVPFRATPAPPPASVLPRLANERVLSLPSGDWRRPTWRPDGRALVASKEEGGKSQLWLVPLDGSPPIQLTFGPGAHVASPGRAWRAERLVYASDEAGAWSIWVMDTKTLRTRNLGPLGGEHSDPVFSPDGQMIALSRRGPGDDRSRIVAGRFFADAKGYGARFWGVRSPADGDATYPQFSPDGRSIMFGLSSASGRDIWLTKAPLATATGPAIGGPPPETPRGSRVSGAPTGAAAATMSATATDTAPSSEPATITTADTTATLLLATRVDRCDAVWLGEAGKEIVFSDAETSTAPADLFVFSDGLIGRLTQTPEAEHSPSVSPDGERLAFERGEVGRRVLVLADLVRGSVAR